MSDGPKLTENDVRDHIREALFEPDVTLDDTTNLVNAGMDSIRVMTLVERWYAEGIEVSFAELAELPTFGQWWELLSAKQNGASGA